MRRSLLTLTVMVSLLTLTSAWAQENESSLIRAKVKQGTLMLGGNLQGSYNITSEANTKTGQELDGRRIDFALRTKNGYFIREDLAVGLDLSVLHESTKLTGNLEREQEPKRETFMLAGPFVRYYFLNGVFGELTALAGLNNISSSGTKYNVLEGGLGLGYAYFIHQRFSLEPIVSFRYFQKKDGKNDREYKQFGPMLGFGLQVYLLRQKAHVIKQGF